MFSKLGRRADFEKMRDSACLSWKSYRVANCASKHTMEKQNTHDDTEKKKASHVAFCYSTFRRVHSFLRVLLSGWFRCRQTGHFEPTLVTGWQRCWGSCRGGRRMQLARTLAGHREWRRQAGKARSLGSLLAAVSLGTSISQIAFYLHRRLPNVSMTSLQRKTESQQALVAG